LDIGRQRRCMVHRLRAVRGPLAQDVPRQVRAVEGPNDPGDPGSPRLFPTEVPNPKPGERGA
jgi:hypothetical protein